MATPNQGPQPGQPKPAPGQPQPGVPNPNNPGPNPNNPNQPNQPGQTGQQQGQGPYAGLPQQGPGQGPGQGQQARHGEQYSSKREDQPGNNEWAAKQAKDDEYANSPGMRPGGPPQPPGQQQGGYMTNPGRLGPQVSAPPDPYPGSGYIPSINETTAQQPGGLPRTEAKDAVNRQQAIENSPGQIGYMASVNEPEGSNVGGNMDASGQPIQGGENQGGSSQPLNISSLDPDEATIGEETFDIFVHGTGFTENSVIIFAGQEEPTDLEDDGTLSTGINMDVWQGADTVKVAVKDGDRTSNEMDFTFHAEPATRKAPPKPTKRKGKGEKAKSKGKR